ncbi:MAG: MBL fold metallo-hydrolase [Acidothermaceae bacterium]
MSSWPTTRARLVRADNPSPMTLEGTNTWVLVEPGQTAAIVVDPGPNDPQHLHAILDAVHSAGAAEVALIVLTHGHPDHAESAATFAASTGSVVRAAATDLCVGAEKLTDGESIEVAGLRLGVVATPGHTADSVCLVVTGDRALLTGDTILGRGSTVVAHPDGKLADYLQTLEKLGLLVEERGLFVVLPGHGPVRDDPAAVIAEYRVHRAQRLDQVRAAIAAGATTVDAVLASVYGDVSASLQHAARWSLLAQLDYLRESGEPAPTA